MKRPNYLEQIRKAICDAPFGTVFVAIDFTAIACREQVNVTLSRLEEERLIRRVMRGVYYKSEYNEFLQEYVAPSPNSVANALARNYGWTIVACGDTALNILGLSTQVPATWVYVSDGPYKEYFFGNTTIQFRKTTNKEISKLSYKTALIIQALRALGKDNVDDAVISKIASMLTEEEKQTMLVEATTATSWIYEHIRKICRR